MSRSDRENRREFGIDAAVDGLVKQKWAKLRELPVVESVKLESKLTSGFSALTSRTLFVPR